MSRQRNDAEEEVARLRIRLDDLPGDDADEWEDAIAAEEKVLEDNALWDARHRPSWATFCLRYAERAGIFKARRPLASRFVPLTRKQKAAARRLVHLMICGDIGK